MPPREKNLLLLTKSAPSQKMRVVAILLILLACISSFSPISSFSQTFRRRFIIAYDVSSPFINAEKKCPAYRQALKNLFSDRPVSLYNEAYQDNINLERKNGLPFFDYDRDEISFFHFNVSGSEMASLRLATGRPTKGEKEVVSDFNRIFLKNKKLDWGAFSAKGGVAVSPSDYITAVLSIQPDPPNFESGVSMSNFVYPLILDKIDDAKYAEEYVLILLSDFLTGSMLGNTKDLDRVRDIYRAPYGVELPPDSPVAYIKRQIDYLASQYYKIDFFQYSFIPPHTNDLIGIIACKIKPKIGVLTPEDVSLFVDGDLSLDQQGYQSQYFRTNETQIKFTHNKNLVPAELKMTVILPRPAGDKVLFEDVMASREEDGTWKSKYADDKRLMSFDSAKLAYFIPGFKILLEPIINKKNFGNLRFQYQFKTKYEVANAQPLNFIYATERALPIESIDYSTQSATIIMTIVIPALILLALLIFLAAYGKPRRIFLHIDGYLDSFEKIDYKTDGKLLTPFKAWDGKLQNGVDHLLVDGVIQYSWPRFPLNWNSSVHLLLTAEKLPAGFELFLKHNLQDIKEFSAGTRTVIKKDKNHRLLFAVGIRQTSITKTIIDPELVKFSVEAVIRDSILFIKSEARKTAEYKFHLGADLHDVWVGFDPGTSGSCVAVGSSADNIILGEDLQANSKIISSVLVFEKAAKFHPNGIEVPENIYRHGIAAQALFRNTTRYTGFQSIKKLLGFKDIKEIKFDNRHTLQLKGKDLAALLVKGLFKDLNAYVNRPGFNADEYKRDGEFNPLRATVAIPNNFTASKIQDMADCIAKLNQFKEIRCVYEAEAVLFYYLSNYSRFNGGKASSDPETILVFDMGGATINVTVVTVNQILKSGRAKYEIDLLGKVGYGIGGDTIDYCIAQFILSCADEFSELARVKDKKVELADLAFEIKKEIIYNYYYRDNFPYLITASQLENFINKSLGVSIKIEEESEMYKYFLKDSGRYKLFGHPFFTRLIYNNVKDAANEAAELSEGARIDRIIFAGRSTSFPLVRETVEKQLNAKEENIKIIALKLEESKTAIAEGACWYGVNKNSILLNNLKTNASFGFKKTQSADKSDVKFYELVEAGCSFDAFCDGIGSFQGTEEIADDFGFDGSKVNFYQVMGKDAAKILAEGQKHKFSKIATIKVDQVTSKVAMKVNENDEVECAVMLRSNRLLKEGGVVSDQEIAEANEEHYTWTL